MRICFCDDEPAMRQLLEQMVRRWTQQTGTACELSCCASAEQMLFENQENFAFDLILLDIQMERMDGIQLAQALRRLRSDIIIVFATAHPKFAVEALKMKADYIIFKPFDREDIADVMERAKLLRRRQRKRIHFHTFGAFDMLVDGEPVKFRSGKAKELMALCVYQNGRPVSIHEIVENLWGENGDGAGYRRTIKELADTLRDYGAEEMFLRSRGSLRVRMDLADSDYQAFMGGDEDAICQFQGEFMQQYSWAEPMVYTLQEKKELMLARMGKRHMQGGG